MIRAAAIFTAVLVSFCIEYAICRACGASSGPAIMAAVLALTLSRRPTPLGHAHALTLCGALLATALGATGVAWLLHEIPALGAAVFILGICASIWMRNFDERIRRIGGMIALPFVIILIAPARANAPGGAAVDLALILGAGLVALASVTAVQLIAGRLGLAILPASDRPAPMQRKREGMSPATRMALQSAVALSAAFIAGFAFFPAHWGWTVLTAYIVLAGARGRGDAALTGVLRLAGALGGSVAAIAISRVWLPEGPLEAVIVFAALFAGLRLREISYAYWAASMTLILALLQQNAASDSSLLTVRIEAIFAGAVCAVAAAWFIFPIRTRDVIRRRVADALAALDELVAHGHLEHHERKQKLEHFAFRIREIERVALPVRVHRRALGIRPDAEHPANWITGSRTLLEHAHGLTENGRSRSAQAHVRRAITISRRAIAEQGKAAGERTGPPLTTALRDVHAAFLAES